MARFSNKSPSERAPSLFPSLGAPGLDFLIPGPGQIPYQIFTQNVSPGSFPSLGGPRHSWARFPHHSRARPHSLSNLYSECYPGSFPSLGAPRLDFLIPGLGQSLFQISAKNVSPGSFPSLCAPWLNFLILGLGHLLYQIFSNSVH